MKNKYLCATHADAEITLNIITTIIMTILTITIMPTTMTMIILMRDR